MENSDLVKQYIMKKRMEEDEQLRAAQEISGETKFNANLGMGLNQLAAGIAGASRVPETPVYDNMIKDADAPVQMALQKQKLNRERGIEDENIRKQQEERDPNSTRAMTYRNIFKSAYPDRFNNGELDGLPLADIKGASDIIGDADRVRLAAEDRKLQREERKDQRAENKYYKDADLSMKQDRVVADSKKEKALSAEEKKALFQSQQGQRAVDGLSSALKNGDNTFSLVGDNDFTRNARIAAEMYGRLQSGGAINKAEEDRFIKMLPGVTDTAEQKKKKIDDAMYYFNQRAASYSKAPVSQTAPQQAHSPGSVVEYKGKRYRVAQDGDTLEPL